MQAKLSWFGDILHVELIGLVQFLEIDSFRQKAMRHFSQNKLILDGAKLQFVGSTGVNEFTDVITELTLKNPWGVGALNFSSEFQKVFQVKIKGPLRLFPDKHVAIRFFEFQDKVLETQRAREAQGVAFGGRDKILSDPLKVENAEPEEVASVTPDSVPDLIKS